jgi:hypothetical protein
LNHRIENREEGAEFFFGDREHHRAIVREMKSRVFVNSAVGAVAENSGIHGDACDVVGSHAFDQRFVQRLIVPFVIFADEDAHQLGFAFAFQRRR